MAAISIPPVVLAPPGEGKLSLLVVEDNEADAHLILCALASNPAVGTITHAPDGVEALRMVDAGEVTPDLAFIDLNMPRKNGLDLLVDLGERKAGGLPMVVLTSSSSPTDAMRSRLRSASRVLTKPDSIDALGAELSAAIAALAPFRPAHRGETTRPPI